MSDATLNPQQAAGALRQVEQEIAKVLVGQSDLVRHLLIGLLCDGHLLLEGGTWSGENNGGEDPQ